MDVWDPAFLDALAAQGFRVITFDYSGLGLSTGERDYSPVALAKDARDLIEALDLEGVAICGWSLGGLAAQVVLALYSDRLSHCVLLGTSPPGTLVKVAEQLFYDTAVIPENSFDDEVILFFEPRSPASRAAAKASHDRIAQRKEGRSPPVPWKWAADTIGNAPKPVGQQAQHVGHRLHLVHALGSVIHRNPRASQVPAGGRKGCGHGHTWGAAKRSPGRRCPVRCPGAATVPVARPALRPAGGHSCAGIRYAAPSPA